jgi:hypothetical protein
MNVAIVVLLLIIILMSSFMFRKILVLFNKTNKIIRSSVEPKFIEINPATTNLVELAVDIWRLGNRLEKVSSSISDDQTKALQNSYTKLKRFLDKNDIGVIDYTNKKHNEGLNLDVLAVEKDSNLKEAIIKETHEPAITIKGQIVKKAKVILLEP